MSLLWHAQLIVCPCVYAPSHVHPVILAQVGVQLVVTHVVNNEGSGGLFSAFSANSSVSGVFNDLLWSDPSERHGVQRNDRGALLLWLCSSFTIYICSPKAAKVGSK